MSTRHNPVVALVSGALVALLSAMVALTFVDVVGGGSSTPRCMAPMTSPST